MSSKKNDGSIRNHLSDLLVYGLILGILLVALRLECIKLDLSPVEGETTFGSEIITLDELTLAMQSKSMLCSAEADVEVMLHRQRTVQRFLFPDSHLEVTLRVSGVVKAGVNLEDLLNGDLEVSQSGGEYTAFVRLPGAEITSVQLYFPDVSWDFSSDLLQLWTRDAAALAIREELMAEARGVLSERAIRAGLLIQAERVAVRTVTETIRKLGIDQVEIVVT